ncbi:MAG: energy transducer TonB [Gammaproteobacteria bacterium]
MTQSVINLQQSAPTDDKLIIAVFIACLVHAALILGLNFSLPEAEKISKSIEITLVTSPTQNAPDKADFLAQENQIGVGKKKKQVKAPTQRIPLKGKTKQKRIAEKPAAKAPAKAPEKTITQQKAETRITDPDKPVKSDDKPRKTLTPEALSRQIAQLGVEIRNQQASSQSEIKFAHSLPSTHKAMAAEYIRNWTEKVTRTGNMNYPEVARENHFSGSLNMDVGINHDGSIYSIRINQSSGIKSLDDAAIRIVRMGAPYAPLPKQLRNELKVLVITRIWQFSDESGFR